MLQSNLKRKNIKFLALILVVNVLSLLALLSNDSGITQQLLNILRMDMSKSGVFILSLSITFTVLLINSVVPANLKASIVFWRLKYALPGCRAFSKLMYNDIRIDTDRIINRHGTFPVAPKAQNNLWYRLFKKYESNIEIKEAHQQFLLFRDASTMSILMLTPLLLALYCNELAYNMAKLPLLLLIFEYLVFMVAARNKGNRLVQNVLALESKDL